MGHLPPRGEGAAPTMSGRPFHPSRHAALLLAAFALHASPIQAQDAGIAPEPREEELGFFEQIAEFFSPTPKPKTAEEKYALAMDRLESGNFLDAVTAFQRVIQEEPYTEEAIEAEFHVALAHYFAGESLLAEDRFAAFRSEHPSHEMLPWALYYEAMTRYNEIGSVDRDQSATRAAVDRFQLFLSRFPDHHLASLVR